MGRHWMKSSRWIFILLILLNFIISYSISKTEDKCAGRWQIIDQLNIKVTLDWQILPTTNSFVTEFRTNLVNKGYWYGFGFASASAKPIDRLVYALQRRENDTEIFWDIYHLTDSNLIRSQKENSSIAFQRLLSSGLLTVRPNLNSSLWNEENQCLYLIYMRGRLENSQPLLPDEIHFNGSACLTCQRSDLHQKLTIQSSTPGVQLTSQDSTSQSVSISTAVPLNSRTEYKLIWFGRILNRVWSNDYLNLQSPSSQNLRLDLENLFLFLINHNSSLSFICHQFDLHSLRSGSILFASNITLISNLSEEQTITTIENLIKPMNASVDGNLHFDLSAHRVVGINAISSINSLSENISRTVDDDYFKRAEIYPTFHLLMGCIVGITCSMIIITSILCLYGYYKCRRREFRLFTERESLKFQYDINSYRWLGQQPSISSSSPYLIQSTSI